MKIKFLGSGSAFVTSDVNFQSNILVTFDDGKNMLIDAGTDIKDALNFHGIKVSDIDDIVITHQHADHCGGLEYLAFYSKFITKKKINLIYGDNSGFLLEKLWDETLKGGLELCDGKVNCLSNYFNVYGIYDKNNNIACIRNEHVESIQEQESRCNNYIKKYDHISMPSFYICLGMKETDVYISGDTNKVDAKNLDATTAKIIFHDCEFAEYDGGVHAQFRHLCQLSDKIKSKMWLYHYSGKVEDHEEKVLANGFAGIVRRGQEFIINNE